MIHNSWSLHVDKPTKLFTLCPKCFGFMIVHGFLSICNSDWIHDLINKHIVEKNVLSLNINTLLYYHSIIDDIIVYIFNNYLEVIFKIISN